MMNRRATILYNGAAAGILSEDDEGYTFQYNSNYLKIKDSRPVSLTLPLQKEPFRQKTMIPFFDGLIPEGWLLHIVEEHWKINPKDRMGLLMTSCRDCIGAVTVEPIIDREHNET